MAILEGTTSPASRSPSPASSDSSIERSRIQKPTGERRNSFPSAPPRRSPEPPISSHVLPNVVKCEWDDCGEQFTNMQSLVKHLHDGHIGVHKSSYTCEWASCPRRGLVQTSRFALVSHCRSHTGEKPFICSLPECDKSFTRSDTLAKHLRQQHNMAPPTPSRGGYRKRKRSMTPPNALQQLPPPPSAQDRHMSGSPILHQHPHPHPHDDPHAPSHYNFANRNYAQYHDARDSGFNTFRVNPAIHDRSALSVSSTMKIRPDGPLPPRDPYMHYDGREEDVASSSDGEDEGKPYNAEAMGGRSKAMVKYLIMKAKYRYVVAEKGLLNDELEVLKRQEKEEWQEKEAGVDRVLRVFGPESEQFIHESEVPMNGKRARLPVAVSPRGDPRMEGHYPREHPPHIPRHAQDYRMEIDHTR